MKIINGKVFIDGKFHEGLEVKYDETGIKEIGKDLKDDEVIDAKGNYVYAGVVDTHCHGGFMRAFGIEPRCADSGPYEEQVKFLCKKLPETGVTTVFPTLAMDLTSFADEAKSVQTIRRLKKEGLEGADPMKFHFEGTYLTLDRYIEPGGEYPLPTKEHSDFLTSGDYSDVAFICLAPEMEGANEWMDYVSSKGVIPEIGYTKATAEDIKTAADHGAKTCSHIFNGYQPMHHRENGPCVGILLEDRIKPQITLDGYHVNKAWVKLTLKVKGIDNCYGMTDLSAVSGLENGIHHLCDGSVVDTHDGYNWRTDGHILSGNMTCNQIMKNARDVIGLTMEEVGQLFTENPAKCLDIKDRGKIEVGRRSDFIILDKDYKVLKTIIKGKVFFENN